MSTSLQLRLPTEHATILGEDAEFVCRAASDAGACDYQVRFEYLPTYEAALSRATPTDGSELMVEVPFHVCDRMDVVDQFEAVNCRLMAIVAWRVVDVGWDTILPRLAFERYNARLFLVIKTYSPNFGFRARCTTLADPKVGPQWANHTDVDTRCDWSGILPTILSRDHPAPLTSFPAVLRWASAGYETELAKGGLDAREQFMASVDIVRRVTYEQMFAVRGTKQSAPHNVAVECPFDVIDRFEAVNCWLTLTIQGHSVPLRAILPVALKYNDVQLRIMPHDGCTTHGFRYRGTILPRSMRSRAEYAREYDGLRYADGALVVESWTRAPDAPPL
jgi:hypothetical protein